MRRKSDRKSKTSPEKKTPERPSRITLRRRRQKSVSSSPEHEKKPTSENEVDSTPLIESNVGSKETSNSNSEEEKPVEQPVWQVKSAETPPGGEIQKLKICLQRPSSTPERAEKSPRRHRKHRGGTSSITDEDSSEGKPKSKSSRKRRHQDNDEEVVESSSEDKLNKIHQLVKDEQNSSDSQQVSSTDIDENSKLCDKEDTAGTPPPGELNEETVGTTSILQKSVTEDDNASHHNGPESTTVIEESIEENKAESAEESSHIDESSHVEDNSSVKESSNVENDSTVEESSAVENHPQVEDTPQLEDGSQKDSSKVEDNSQIQQTTEDQPEKSLTPEPIHNESITTTEVPDEVSVLKEIVETIDTDPTACVKDNESTEKLNQDPQISESSETKPDEKTESSEQEIEKQASEQKIEKENKESENQEPERSHTPEPPIKTSKPSNVEDSKKLDVEETSNVPGIKSDDSAKESEKNIEKPQKQFTPEKMDVEESNTENIEKSQKINEKRESINHENQINEKNEMNIEIPRETNESSGEDERSPVRSSVVSVVNQVQSDSYVEAEPTEEQSTYVADPTRKKLKLKESISEYIQTKLRLTSDNVREICPDLKVLSLDEVRLEDDTRNYNDDDVNASRKAKKKPFEDKKITIQTVKEYTTAPTVVTSPPITTNPMLANRKISIVGDESSNLHRPPSPAKNEPSPILYIKNLVRPFTLNQLKELLSRTGTIKENGFWINKIKSECYVQYETLEQSVETRNALHGVHWPVANGRRLDVDFGTEEAMEKARAPTEIKHEIKTEVPATPEAKPKEEPVDWREVRERERLKREQRGVREWDVGKQGPERSPSPPATKRRQHSPPSRNISPDRKIRKKEDVPSKLLDDLFRKTKATPCIYWLPLSAEMIVIKEEQRRKHMAEHERRLAEIRRVERMRRAPGGGRSRDGGRNRYN